MKFTVLSLFPAFVDSMREYSVIGKAIQKGLIDLRCVDIRDYTQDKHNNVDDYSYGGGPGMVMQAQPVVDAIEKNRGWNGHVICLSPRGKVLDQNMLKSLAEKEHIVLVNGHYEGIDQRALDHYVDEEISLGDYVLSGGELASMVLIDGIARLIKGVLSNENSPIEESHSAALLEHGHYTRPANFRGYKVPEVLLSGDHKKIEIYRRRESLKTTYMRRPELLAKAELSKADIRYLRDLKKSLKEDSDGHH
ncbi:tRNA (guanine-N(1)-)-methyltransferase [Aedoeadaptatus ivorii]|uniref:tRNA (guanine-N(1)-)-methyltransferase n=1 Tax=Aedoeadaptatus ivorii TaxID=54006 RepID=A0A448V1Z2_9FIRM|nr:tRNA (guanosine(37)-N1)-methyltransferase TrmD [Peptoniphilus ivorii]VEJ35704.1 tRNA (guanine-N(1)-)-methyltransferase [Peptoniphilus ivorii]